MSDQPSLAAVPVLCREVAAHIGSHVDCSKFDSGTAARLPRTTHECKVLVLLHRDWPGRRESLKESCYHACPPAGRKMMYLKRLTARHMEVMVLQFLIGTTRLFDASRITDLAV